MISVTQFMRRPRPGVFSLERLHHDVRTALPKSIRVKVHVCRNFSTGVLPRLHDMWIARRHRDNVNHVTGDVHFLAIVLPGKRTVLTVPDLVLLKRFTGLRRWVIWAFWYWWPVRNSAEVITISEATRADLLKTVKCDPQKVHVIHCPVSPAFQHSPKRFCKECPVVLLVGTGWNKNVEAVVESLAGIRCNLLIIGKLSERQLTLLNQSKIDFECLENLTADGVVAQYKRADLLVFTSIFEGFGLPIIEAQAVGRPVVTSNIEPMKEVAGGAACLVDPMDPAHIRDGVLRVINDDDYRNELTRKGLENAERFSARTIANRYAEVYGRLANR